MSKNTLNISQKSGLHRKLHTFFKASHFQFFYTPAASYFPGYKLAEWISIKVVEPCISGRTTTLQSWSARTTARPRASASTSAPSMPPQCAHPIICIASTSTSSGWPALTSSPSLTWILPTCRRSLQVKTAPRPPFVGEGDASSFVACPWSQRRTGHPATPHGPGPWASLWVCSRICRRRVDRHRW